MTYTDLNKKELLKLATEQNITGRHDMSKDQLIEALEAVTEPGESVIDADTLKDLKRRKPSTNERDDKGMVIREGKNLSGNAPFRRKFYYLEAIYADLDKVSETYADALAAAPNQVKLILRYMREFEVTEAEVAKQGGEIVEEAKKRSYIQSKIPSANLFAYYRRVLEALGVREA